MSNQHLQVYLAQRRQAITAIRSGGSHSAEQYRIVLRLLRRLIHQEIMDIRRERRHV